MEIVLGLNFYNIIELVVRTTTVDGDLVTKAPYDWMFYATLSGDDHADTLSVRRATG